MNAPTIFRGQEVIPLSDLAKMAEAIASSGLFGMKQANQALALMLVAQAEGQHPATVTQDYDIIQGKGCRKTHSVLARFQAAGGKVQWQELTAKVARATFSHPSGGSLEIEWTIEQAKAIGLTNKDNWKNYPRAMLRARCIAEGVRAVFPAAIGGMLVAEEAQDLEPINGTVEKEPVTKPKRREKVINPEPEEPEPASGPAAEPPSALSAPPADDGGGAPETDGGGPRMSEGQVRILTARLEGASMDPQKLVAKFGGDLSALPAAKFNEVAAFIRASTA